MPIPGGSQSQLGAAAVAVAFFGEGAANQGSFHESLNLAALWKLPAVFVCEDNSWAISVAKDHVYEAAATAVKRAREGGGPTLIEVKTDRYMGHFQGDAEVYRPKGEVEALSGPTRTT